MTKAFLGRTAVITGGARGFGKTFAEALADEGAHVALIDLEADAVRATAQAINAAGGSATAFVADVCDETGIAGVMAEAAKMRGGIDLLINNAGLHADEYSRPIADMGFAKVRKLFDVNMIGVINCTLAASPFMAGRANASIVNIASSAAHLGGTAYGVSKLAVAGLTITFARELGEQRIRVNAISPGMILTEIIRRELPDTTKQRIRAMQFLDIEGEERDILEAMLFLASDRARFITGEILRVGGGMGAGI